MTSSVSNSLSLEQRETCNSKVEHPSHDGGRAAKGPRNIEDTGIKRFRNRFERGSKEGERKRRNRGNLRLRTKQTHKTIHLTLPISLVPPNTSRWRTTFFYTFEGKKERDRHELLTCFAGVPRWKSGCWAAYNHNLSQVTWRIRIEKFNNWT